MDQKDLMFALQRQVHGPLSPKEYGDALLAGQIKRDKALVQVQQNADQVWLAQAWSVLRAYCRAHPGLVFTVPGFVLNSYYKYDLPHPREARVWGAIFRQAAKQGLIEKTGSYMQSPDPRQHLRPVACWRVV